MDQDASYVPVTAHAEWNEGAALLAAHHRASESNTRAELLIEEILSA